MILSSVFSGFGGTVFSGFGFTMFSVTLLMSTAFFNHG
jgi:hypothetical protein